MIKKKNEFVWSQKYRPSKIDDLILSLKLKRKFKKYIREGDIPNLILNGPSGMGKSAVSVVLCEELGLEYILINGSKDGNIDVIRNTVERFASHMSFNGKRKVIIFDEGDNLSDKSMTALQPLVEQYSKNCSFVFTTNHYEKFKTPIKSRFTVINFTVEEKDRSDLMNKTFLRMVDILNEEQVEFDKKVLITLIKNLFPDIRKLIDTLQDSTDDGKLEVTSISKTIEFEKEFFSMLKKNSVAGQNEMLKYVDRNMLTMQDVITLFEDHIETYVCEESYPEYIVIASQFDYRNYFATNELINVKAFLVTLMKKIRFK